VDGVDGKCFESGAFPKQWRRINHEISLTDFSSNTNLKWLTIFVFKNFGEHLMRFSE